MVLSNSSEYSTRQRNVSEPSILRAHGMAPSTHSPTTTQQQKVRSMQGTAGPIPLTLGRAAATLRGRSAVVVLASLLTHLLRSTHPTKSAGPGTRTGKKWEWLPHGSRQTLWRRSPTSSPSLACSTSAAAGLCRTATLGMATITWRLPLIAACHVSLRTPQVHWLAGYCGPTSSSTC
jgi:hypothetical protein